MMENLYLLYFHFRGGFSIIELDLWNLGSTHVEVFPWFNLIYGILAVSEVVSP